MFFCPNCDFSLDLTQNLSEKLKKNNLVINDVSQLISYVKTNNNKNISKN